jgi:hypothetical protein
MQIRIFTLAADASAEDSEEPNKILPDCRILGVQQVCIPAILTP